MINETLKRYSFPPFLIDRITKSYLNKVHSNSNQSNPESDKTHFINCHILENTQSKFRKSFQNSLNNSAKMLILKLFFYFFYINNYFSNKDKTLYFLKSFLIYKSACARCNSCYIGETCRHFKTRNDEHVKKDKKF